MEDIRQDNVLSFDTCFCNNQIRMLKVLVPFLDSSLQKYLCIYIKYLEIQYIMQCYKQPLLLNGTCFGLHSSDTDTEFCQIFDQLIPLCSPKEKEQFLHIRNLFETFQNIKNMMEMMESMKELFPEGMDNMGDIASMFGINGTDDLSAIFGMMDGFNNK